MSLEGKSDRVQDAPRPTCKGTKQNGREENALSLLKPCQSGKQGGERTHPAQGMLWQASPP